MADTTIQAFCCCNQNKSEFVKDIMHEFNSEKYIDVCLIASTFGIVGALYQIFFRRSNYSISNRVDNIEYDNGRKIIVWLAFADVCGSAGVFMRSILWKYISNIMPNIESNNSVLFCSITSAWIQYFYTCTWLWTLFYAIDVRKKVRKEYISVCLYHKIIWPLSALLTAIGLSVLFMPDAQCEDIHSLPSALPNSLFTYGPMLLIMILNPILYFNSMKEYTINLSNLLNQQTENERTYHKTFKMKYALITVIFYVCWLPNLINGMFIWFLWHDLPLGGILICWYAMAVLNPLQAFFNCFVYRRWYNIGITNVTTTNSSDEIPYNDSETSPIFGNYRASTTYASI